MRSRSVPGQRWRARWHVDVDERERGSATVEFVICIALMVFMLMAIVQFAIFFHLRSVAITAARQGVDHVRTTSGSAEAGIAVSNQFLDQAGRSLDDRNVTATRTGTVSSVTVSGRVVAIIPLLSLHVSATADAPTERTAP
jgi:Flp pilus assembly protein TadG